MKRRIELYRYRALKVLKTHQTFVVLVSILLVLLAVLLRLSALNTIPVDQSYLLQKMNGVKAVKFNRDAISQIEDLNESNVSNPGTQLPTNRQNPFSE